MNEEHSRSLNELIDELRQEARLYKRLSLVVAFPASDKAPEHVEHDDTNALDTLTGLVKEGGKPLGMIGLRTPANGHGNFYTWPLKEYEGDESIRSYLDGYTKDLIKRLNEIPGRTATAINTRLKKGKVRVFDAGTDKVTEIPAGELAPGMISVYVVGVGEVWMDSSKVKHGEVRHPPLDDATRARLKPTWDAIKEVYNVTFQQWEDGFRADSYPEQEITMWEHIASVYGQYAKGILSIKRRKEVFALIMSCANSPRETVFQIAQLGSLSRELAEQIVAKMYGPCPPPHG